MNLSNKVAFITGAAQGIGKAASIKLAEYGADIIAADLQIDGVEQTVKEIEAIGRAGLALEIDVTKSKQVKNAAERAIDKYGRIDILVNGAGVAIQSKIENLSEELWDKIMDINAKGVFLCCKEVMKYMIPNKSGKIVNVSSQTAKIGEVANGAYCSSKAAVSMFTQVFALEMAEHKINVNAVCPGLVDTEMIQKAMIKFSEERGLDQQEFQNSWLSDIPLKRMARPDEIGELIAFLASDKSDFITGVSYTIAGGMTLI